MIKLHKILLGMMIFIMSIFFVVKTFVLLGIWESSPLTRGTEYTCFLMFIPLFYSLNRNYVKNQKHKAEQTDKFLSTAAIISIADKHGKITYVNEKFEQVSGYKLEEVLGKDHSIVNSGTQPDGYWGNMYATVLKGEIWNDVVCNKAKDGSLYYVDTYIRARFDSSGNLEGFSSIRQDITDLKKKELDIRNRMTAINQSNAVIEFDTSGNIIYANQNFCDAMGYTLKELKGKHHSIFCEEKYSQSDEYEEFWSKLKNGDYVSAQFNRIKKNGEDIWLQATYNPIFDNNGQTVRVMKIAVDITDKVLQSQEIERKNTYLEHAAKILRHDMHSGINTYIPRGISSLERRLKPEDIQKLKIEAPLKMIKEGLIHTQKVYKGVYEFTNLVKKDAVLDKNECNLKNILDTYLTSTSYKSQILIKDLPTIEVNEALFCTAVDNLIRNGLKYNDSDSKMVTIFMEDNSTLIVQDNGRGMTQEEFDYLSKPYTRKTNQKESGTGLGLNICVAILSEHGFKLSCEKNDIGTKMKIKIKND
jgi:PAS domain S-box-containing protein